MVLYVLGWYAPLWGVMEEKGGPKIEQLGL